jgi:enoyl-CoA hydratase/carnithine racemase
MLNDELVLCAKEGATAIVSLNRPAKLNALTLAMRRRLLGLMQDLEADPTIRAVVVRGEGPRAFSTGSDLEELSQRTVETELGEDGQLRRVLHEFIERMQTPTIAALHGFVLGAGLELALACTLRIAADDAVLGLPEVRHGVIPGSGGTQRLARLVGVGWALDMILTQRFLSAEESLRVGLVTRLCSPATLVPQAASLAQKLAQLPSTTVTAAKQATMISFSRGMHEDVEMERLWFAICLAAKSRAHEAPGSNDPRS